jgi:hypothetical protein
MVGKSHPTLSDTLNVALRTLLSQSGMDPDADALDLRLIPMPGVINARIYAADTSTGMCTAIRAILAAFPTGGITIDARGFTVAQTFDAELAITQPEVTILWPQCAVAMGAFSLRVAAGAHGVQLIWPKGWNGYLVSSSFLKPRWTYSGSGIALRVGTSAADTFAFVAVDPGFDLEAAGAGAVGISLERVLHYELVRPLVHDDQGVGADNKVGIQLIGTGSFTGWGTILDPILNRFNPALKMLVANANQIIGGEIRGSVASGSNGVDLDTSTDNLFLNTDIDGLVIGFRFRANAQFNRVILRTEQSNTTDVQFDLSGRNNRVECERALVIVDNGNKNSVQGSPVFDAPTPLAAGNNNDYALNAALRMDSVIRVNGDAANSIITGIAGGYQGRRLCIMVASGTPGTVTISNQDANSAAANRILHPSGASPVLSQNDVVSLVYDNQSLRWRVCSVLQ